MKIKMGVGVSLDDFLEKCTCLGMGQYAQRVRKQNTFDRLLSQKIQKLKNVVFGIAHSVAPILQIHIGVYANSMGFGNNFFNFRKVLFRSLFKLMG